MGSNNRRRWLVNSPAFQGLCDWAFHCCDADENGLISKKDLHSGLLLVHLNLAKYVGVAATQPLNRTQMDELFDIAARGKGKIGRPEFQDIVVLSCARITSRMAIYYLLLGTAVPFLTAQLVRLWNYCFPRLGQRLANSNHLWALGVTLTKSAVSVTVWGITQQIRSARYVKKDGGDKSKPTIK